MGVCRSLLFTETEQDAEAILSTIKYEGISRVRIAMTHSSQKETIKNQILKCNDLDLEVYLCINFSANPEFFVDGAEQRQGDTMTPYKYSDLDLTKAEDWFEEIFYYFNTNNCMIWGIEVGNEVNWFGYNGDFPIVTNGCYYLDPELSNPTDLRSECTVLKYDYTQLGDIATGARLFGKVCYRAWTQRNSIWGSTTSPKIVMGGLNRPIDGAYDRNGSFLMPDAWLKILKGTFTNQPSTETSSQLGHYNAYGVHFYPGLKYQAPDTFDYNYDTEVEFKTAATNSVHAFMDRVVDVAGTSKPYHITELGFSGWPYREVDEDGYYRQEREDLRLAVHMFFMEVLNSPEFSYIDFERVFWYGWDDEWWSYYHAPKESAGIFSLYD
jgi:hypothetical protein